MNIALQIRDVPEDVRDILARRAAELGQSLQKYLLDVVIREAGQQQNVELLRAVRPGSTPGDVAESLAVARTDRTRQIEDAVE